MDVNSWFRRSFNKLKITSHSHPSSAAPASDGGPSSISRNKIKEEEEQLYGVTDHLVEFVKSFSIETFRSFSLPDGEGSISDGGNSGNVRNDLSDWQEKHAMLVLSRVEELSQLRFKLCPRYLKERQFWRIYFALVKSYVTEEQSSAIKSVVRAMPAMKKNAECVGFEQVFSKLVKEIGSPVDFELPEWLNKWKPTCSFIRRNVYLTKKIKRRDDGIFCSCSSTPGSSGVCGRDCLCSMLRSSCSSGCNCGSSCLNKPFHQRPVKRMKSVQTEKCGMGIVAEEDINQGEFVIEYVGEVIDDKTCEERLWKMKHRGETNFYLCEINRDMVIDATYKGNKSRYINHSCCPNTEMQKWMIDGETRIGIFATHDIKMGEHLTYDYQFVQFGADQDCHCGAADCRRKLGVKPNRTKMPSSDAALKIVACQVAGNSAKVYSNGVPVVGGLPNASSQRRKMHRNCIGSVIKILNFSDKRSFGIIRRYDNTTRKHLIAFEDGNSEFLDLSKEEWEFCKC